MRYYITLFLFIWGVGLQGQQVWLSDETSDILSVDLLDLPSQDNQKLNANARSAGSKLRPKVFATPINTTVRIQNEGTWESTSSGKMVWRQRIRSRGAYSLNLAFKDFQLPESAVLFLYDLNKSSVIGPVTARDNDRHGEWWSPILPFDEVVVEVQVEESDAKSLHFEISQVNHDFSGLGALMSGSCNLDVICAEADGYGILDDYRDIIQSVGLFILEGFQLCSGFLINNTRNDCTPYFLTAFHCDVTTSNAASVVVFWNYENSFCRLPGTPESGSTGDGSFERFNSGASVVSGDEYVDFRLLLLDDDVNPEYRPFFAGWNVTGEVFDTTICIHHPNGEEKRFSADFDPPVFFAQEKFVRVTDWDIGTTEEGSSGSPLFSEDKHVIGLLSEGLASCQNDLLDDFASMKLAWEGGGSPNTRLKDWLDPDQTGITILDGKNCARSIVVDKASLLLCASNLIQDTVRVSINSGFESGAELEVVDISGDIQVSLSSDSIRVGDEVLAIFAPGSNFTASQAFFTVLASAGTDKSNVIVRLNFEYDLPAIPVLLSPSDTALLLETTATLSWEPAASSYELEIYTDTTSAPLAIFEDLTESDLQVAELASGNHYFWRVKAQNICGESLYSAFRIFSVMELFCENYLSDHDPIVIAENVNIIQSQITIPDIPGYITDINIIDVRGRHSYLRDLQIQVVSPAGTVVDLVVNPCFDEDNFFASFDDEADSNILDCPFDTGKNYVPDGDLSDFDGEEIGGLWTLIIDDQVNMDGGTFLSWGIEFCLDQSNFRSVRFIPGTIEYCERDTSPIFIQGLLSGTFNDISRIALINDLGSEISTSISPGLDEVKDTIMVTFNSTSELSGLNLLHMIVESDAGNDSFELAVNQTGGPSRPLLSMPVDGAVGVDRQPRLEWAINDDVESVRFEVFSDPDGTDRIYDTLIRDDKLDLPFRLNQNTLYFWKVISIGTCDTTESTLFSFTTEMSVSVDNEVLDGFFIFPNPTQNWLTIKIPQAQKAKAFLYDVKGALLLESDVIHGEGRLDLSPYHNGIYILELRVEGNHYFTKVLLNR